MTQVTVEFVDWRNSLHWLGTEVVRLKGGCPPLDSKVKISGETYVVLDSRPDTSSDEYSFIRVCELHIH